MVIELSPKLSKLFCELKSDRIMKEYETIESKYNQIEELFDLPETEKRNLGIASACTKFSKDIEKFDEALNHAYKQLSIYSFWLETNTIVSAHSKKICEKKLTKQVSTEWLKNIGTLCEYSNYVRDTISCIQNISQRVYDLLGRLKSGVSCIKESLKEEETELESYSNNLKQTTSDLKYLIENEARLRPDFLTANLQHIKSHMEEIYPELKSKAQEISRLTIWLDNRLKHAKSKEKKQELEEKIKKTVGIATDYTIFMERCQRVLNAYAIKRQSPIRLHKS